MTREEAINIVRDIYHTDTELEALEVLIPELAESEDERIRKELIETINCMKEDHQVFLSEQQIERYLAYLEKQKEQKPILKFKVGDKVHLEGDDVNIVTITGIEKDRYLTNNAYVPVLFRDENIWERIEQKPRKFKLGDKVHWWYDDDTNVVTITGFRDDAYLTDSAYGPILFSDEDNWERIEQKPEEKPINWTELTWKDINELEGIINNVHYEFRNGIGQESFGKEVLEKFREYKGDEYLDEIEQKPTEWSDYKDKINVPYCSSEPEWSEEDGKQIAQIERIVKNAGCAKMLQEKIHNWFDSLRPSWKPSEEEIGALNYAYCELFKRKDIGHSILGSLQKLCDDLKKLI